MKLDNKDVCLSVYLLYAEQDASDIFDPALTVHVTR